MQLDSIGIDEDLKLVKLSSIPTTNRSRQAAWRHLLETNKNVFRNYFGKLIIKDTYSSPLQSEVPISAWYDMLSVH
jgi:hypothetical protein